MVRKAIVIVFCIEQELGFAGGYLGAGVDQEEEHQGEGIVQAGAH